MSLLRCLTGILAVCLTTTIMTPAPAPAGDKDSGEKVRVATVDGVELHAVFYSCKNPKAKNPPVVIMLHPIGENSTKKPWVALAETLRAHAAVMVFDFRGHGQSTEISNQAFWQVPFNRQYIKDSAKALQAQKMTIEFKEFEKGYYPALCNDISAIRCFLDRKNDSGGVNTSSIILVGAETGATLGAIWLNSEYHRHKMVQNPVNLLMAPDPKSEGRDIIACVWLSATSTLGTKTVNVGSTLDPALRHAAVPMVFMYGEDDKKGAAVAASAVKFITAKDKVKYQYTAKVPVPKTELSGVGLLQKSLGVDALISKYLEGVIDAKQREWEEREFRKKVYGWRPATVPAIGNFPVLTIKGPGDTNLVFDPYLRFAK